MFAITSQSSASASYLYTSLWNEVYKRMTNKVHIFFWPYVPFSPLPPRLCSHSPQILWKSPHTGDRPHRLPDHQENQDLGKNLFLNTVPRLLVSFTWPPCSKSSVIYIHHCSFCTCHYNVISSKAILNYTAAWPWGPGCWQTWQNFRNTSIHINDEGANWVRESSTNENLARLHLTWAVIIHAIWQRRSNLKGRAVK